jgi:hypothetical protein
MTRLQRCGSHARLLAGRPSPSPSAASASAINTDLGGAEAPQADDGQKLHPCPRRWARPSTASTTGADAIVVHRDLRPPVLQGRIRARVRASGLILSASSPIFHSETQRCRSVSPPVAVRRPAACPPDAWHPAGSDFQLTAGRWRLAARRPPTSQLDRLCVTFAVVHRDSLAESSTCSMTRAPVVTPSLGTHARAAVQQPRACR